MNKFSNILRNLKNNPMLITINIPGLTAGLMVFLLLILFVKHELSYDNCFPNGNRVVRLYNTLIEENSTGVWPICLREAYTEIPQQIPGIEAAVQIYRGWGADLKSGEKIFRNLNYHYADKEFFKVFGLGLITGNSDEALKGKNKMVLTRSLANKMFGSSHCVGKVVNSDGVEYTITGVMDNLPTTTHFNFDFLESMETVDPGSFGGMEFFTYYLLNKNVDAKQTKKDIATLNSKIVYNRFKDFELKFEVKSGVEKLKDIHLYTPVDFDLTSKGDLSLIYVIALIAALVLLIATVNHVNLLVLHGEKRFFEIGMRKSLGAGRTDIMGMFYFETAAITFISFVLAFLLLPLILPGFASLLGSNITVAELLNPGFILLSVLFLAALIFVSGAYPALYLSKLNALSAIKKDVESLSRKKRLSVASVVIQFFISIFLIFTLIVIYSQVNYLKRVPLGFTAENVVGINGFGNKISGRAKAITDELKKLPFITGVGTSDHSMGGGCSGQLITKYGSSSNNWKSINEYRVRPGFCKTLQLQLVAGRFFKDIPDDKNAIILNQAAVRMLGLKNPVNTKLIMFDDPMTVIGVVKNFYFMGNAGNKIPPLVLTDYSQRVSNFYLRTARPLSKKQWQTVSDIFASFDPDFLFYHFNLKDVYNGKYATEDRLIKIIFYGMMLALFLSFIGMFALSVFNVERKTKEIGIRKVLGGSPVEIVRMLLYKMLRWVLWTMIPAFAVAYLVLNRWLEGYTKHIEIGIAYFIVTGFVTLLIAALAVSFKSIYAATRNPVYSLKYE